jgi:hypothetical protein
MSGFIQVGYTFSEKFPLIKNPRNIFDD